MRCPKCGAELAPDDKFCSECGAPCPKLPPHFEAVERDFAALKARYEAGAISDAEYDAALEKLVIQDEEGKYWMIGAETGQWYWFDGREWVKREPPAERVEAPVREDAWAATEQLAGFGVRLGAYIVDWIILLIIHFITTGISLVLTEEGDATAGSCLWALVAMAYLVGFWTYSGQTPGKMVTRIKVISTDGTDVTFGKALIRLFGYLVSSLIVGLGFLWVLWDEKKQGWHDKIAGTYVIRAR